ncbi:hypothetical protein A3718_10985 [Erythrobacter sp. HI0019]|uniref:hypothetical protein n=1 Tax=unclassified Erythrobacter TaxID=2633097 RepID=UPI0007B9E468|nr:MULTISPECIES: hypothetical protein [unclassified Erythrobacter]KZX92855.1 hypothetical protein A3718_10985 [Erythrobacter sp. HI0019]KZY01017.1 hypothetical protein A3723_06350 [Erythrobacter sp. HI0028]
MPESEFRRSNLRAFKHASSAARAKAAARYTILSEVEVLQAEGVTASAAVFTVARRYNLHQSTIWVWRSAVNGCDLDPVNRLSRLLPKEAADAR